MVSVQDQPDAPGPDVAGDPVDARLGAQDVLAVAEHELANQVVVVRALADTLDRNWDRLSPTDQRNLVRRIRVQAARLASLLAQIRELSTGSALGVPHPSPRRTEPDTTEMLRSMAADLAAALAEHRVDVDIADGLPAVAVDAERLQQVLLNLLTNAARHSPPGSPIVVRAFPASTGVRVTVEDGGPGIPDADREQVFDKGVRLGASGPGRGLGLYISRALLRAVGADIWVDTTASGGARMVIDLPAR